MIRAIRLPVSLQADIQLRAEGGGDVFEECERRVARPGLDAAEHGLRDAGTGRELFLG